MFKRKILAELNSQFQVLKEAHQAIVIRGPRQVGKTTTALAFAKEHYQNVIYINFMDQITLKSVFSGDIVIDRIIRDLLI